MPTLSARPLRIAFLLAALVAGCSDVSSGPTPPPATGVLIPGIWYMHSANGDALPAMIADRIVGVALEETFLDSATLMFDAAGSYEQRYWLRINVTSVLDREEVVLDQGTFSVTGAYWTFSSTVRPRSFTVVSPLLGRVTTDEPMLYWSSAPSVAGEYRLTPP